MVRPHPDLNPEPADDGKFKDDGSMYLHAACHISSPTWAALHPTTGIVTILCAECRKVITRLQVVRKDTP